MDPTHFPLGRRMENKESAGKGLAHNITLVKISLPWALLRYGHFQFCNEKEPLTTRKPVARPEMCFLQPQPHVGQLTVTALPQDHDNVGFLQCQLIVLSRLVGFHALHLGGIWKCDGMQGWSFGEN